MNDIDHIGLAAQLIEAARREGADQADAMVVSAISSAVGVAGGSLEEAERAEATDIGLRVILGKRQASVSSSDLREAAVSEMAARVVAMARAAPDDPWCGLADPGETGGAVDAASLELSDPAEMPGPDVLEALAREAEDAASAVPGVTQVEQAATSWSRDRVTIVQTNGFSGSYTRSSCSIAVSAIAGDGLARERDWAAETRRFWSDLPSPGVVGTRAGHRAAALLSPRRPPSGNFPVIYDERVAGGLIGHMLGAINGSSVARGASWLRDAMGRQILPAGFDVIEDPLILRGRASRPFDAEGIAAARRNLVENGVLQSWVLDLATGRQLGMRTTGNARRGISGTPSPGTTNIRVTQGSRTRDDLVREMGRGLIVTSFIGASINPTTGAYSRGASGFWVEGGEIVHPVNEITLAGSLPEMLPTIVAANDADPEKAVSVPSLLVEGLTVGA
ncbi:TldD/PmbA family protein [Limibaculum sp. M0105]|uniref:TldD/PmbA family protein n=1 Tax=Thermohalobaculum xanthum TaxID=2753746 RepID=A0A8J7M534_9RHOB|nr:TldD/PmbA family protein [Thermohalobaculum xanthum]MBK0397882.1 TldD/PmbA family protein [Thermohalobaculum xanthum]